MQRLSNSTFIFFFVVVGAALVLYNASQQWTRAGNSPTKVPSPRTANDGLLALATADGVAASPICRLPSPDWPAEGAEKTIGLISLTNPEESTESNQELPEQEPVPMNALSLSAPQVREEAAEADTSLSNIERDVAAQESPPHSDVAMDQEPESELETEIGSEEAHMSVEHGLAAGEHAAKVAIGAVEEATPPPISRPIGAAESKDFAQDRGGKDAPGEPRYAGIQDFRMPLEADPSWVVGATSSEPIDREALLRISLPQEISARVIQMLSDATAIADRGAIYTAKQQFLRIIRITCQSLDAQVGRPIHSRALARGLRALEEADDFAVTGNSPEADVHLKGFIAGHRTPVLKDHDSSNTTALLAMQAYYRYAFDQLSLAGNNESTSSKALFALGRVESLLSAENGSAAGGGPKSLALYHAALTVDPHNALAANELGVMLAYSGRPSEAQQVLLQATRTRPSPTSLQNLAKVQQQLGDSNASRQSSQRASRLGAASSRQKANQRFGGVVWVDHAQFNSAGAQPREFGLAPSANTSNQQASHAQPVPIAPAKKKKKKKKFRWPRSNGPTSNFWNF